MKFNGRDYEGESLYDLLPWSGSFYGPSDTTRQFKTYIEQGGQVYLEITKGARKGTVGRLVITPEQCVDYRKSGGGYYKDKWLRNMTGLYLEFDDRKTTVPIDMAWTRPKKIPHALRFTATGTTWVYTTKPKPTEEAWTPRDFFGNEITQGSLVFFSANDGNNRIGKVQRWSNKGTMWVDTVPLKAGVKSQTLTHGVVASQMILIDAYPDLKGAVTLKKLAG